MSVSRDQKTKEWDDTFILFLPNFILTRRDVVYLPSNTAKQRESADECALSRNRAG